MIIINAVNMKIKFVLLLMLLGVGSCFYGQDGKDDLSGSLTDKIMIIWTKIDIVRAINTDHNQKNMFLKDLLSDSLDAYYLLRQLKTVPNISNVQYDQDIVNLVQSVRKSFQEVFCMVNNVDVYCFGFVLQNIVNLLKMPEDIQSQIST